MRSRAVRIGSLLIGIAVPASAATFKHDPYAQNVTANQAVVMWSQDTGSASITYGPKDGGITVLAEPAIDGGAHEVTLPSLGAGTRYAYSVSLQDGGAQAGEFSTAATSSQNFSFLVDGCNRTNNADHQTVVNAMVTESVDFVVNTGDILEIPIAAQYDTFFSIEAALLEKNAFFTTLGNNEYNGGLDTLWNAEFANPSGTSGTESYYYFDWGNSRIIVLNANANSTTQATWLDGVLADASSKNIDHTFAVMFHGPYDSGNHGENTTAQTDWVPVFQKYGVDLLLSGFDDDYERGFNSTTNLRYIVTGGGGAPLFTVNSMQPYQQKFVSALHYVRIDVAGPVVTVTAKMPDGTVIDSFSWSTESLDGGTPDGGISDGGISDSGSDAASSGGFDASSDAASSGDSGTADASASSDRDNASDSGCGCRISGPTPTRTNVLGLLTAGLLLFARRKRRSR